MPGESRAVRSCARKPPQIHDLDPKLPAPDQAPQPGIPPGPAGPVAWRTDEYRRDVFPASENSLRTQPTAMFRIPRAIATGRNVLGRNRRQHDRDGLPIDCRLLEVQGPRRQLAVSYRPTKPRSAR